MITGRSDVGREALRYGADGCYDKANFGKAEVMDEIGKHLK